MTKDTEKKISDHDNCFEESAQDYEIENGREESQTEWLEGFSEG